MALLKSIRPSVRLTTHMEQLILEKMDFQFSYIPEQLEKLSSKSHSPTNIKENWKFIFS
jgi:hypothetical protein